jgi:lysozyme family protein
MDFEHAFAVLIGNEGGYSNDPADPGGETMWGVTARVARRHGYTGMMKDLPLETAKAIAKSEYWDLAHCDEITDALRFDVFDAAYNSGVHEAIVLLQRAAGIEADGVFGPKTEIVVTNDLMAERLRRAFNAERLDFMTKLKNWPEDSRGWVRRVAANLRRA